jgi:hypothetical protein
MACPLYDEIRLTFLEETERALQAPAHGRRLRVWRQGADGSRFDIVMSLDDKGHIGRLASYLVPRQGMAEQSSVHSCSLSWS